MRLNHRIQIEPRIHEVMIFWPVFNPILYWKYGFFGSIIIALARSLTPVMCKLFGSKLELYVYWQNLIELKRCSAYSASEGPPARRETPRPLAEEERRPEHMAGSDPDKLMLKADKLSVFPPFYIWILCRDHLYPLHYRLMITSDKLNWVGERDRLFLFTWRFTPLLNHEASLDSVKDSQE